MISQAIKWEERRNREDEADKLFQCTIQKALINFANPQVLKVRIPSGWKG